MAEENLERKHGLLVKSLRASALCIAVGVTLATPALAQSDIGLKGIGPRLGYVDPESSLDGTLVIGGDVQLGEFVPQLKWDASLSYWRSEQDWSFAGYHYNWSLSDLAVRSGVNYHFLEGDWEPYAGGGLGLHFYSWDHDGAVVADDDSETEFGVYIDGGVHHQFSSQWSGQAQVQLDFNDVDQTTLFVQAIYCFEE